MLLLIAAVGAIVLAGRKRRNEEPPRRRRPRREAGRWPPSGFDLVSRAQRALLFGIGVAGVLLRRNPLVILLCLELMLNAGTLALVAFRAPRATRTGRSLP